MEQGLDRFIKAQKAFYKEALEEIRQGQKQSHWMWFIFPQIIGLGQSETAQYYSIKNLQEAKDFLNDEVLGANLREISEALLKVDSNDAEEVMGWPDDMKLRSSMTLFSLATKENGIFRKVMDKFFGGRPDAQTVDILSMGHLVTRIDDPDFGCEGRPDGEEAMGKVYLTELKTEEEIQIEIPDAELYRKEINEGDEVALSPDGVILKL